MHKSEFQHGHMYYKYATFWLSTPEIFVGHLGFWRPSLFWAGPFDLVHKIGCSFVNINARMFLYCIIMLHNLAIILIK